MAMIVEAFASDLCNLITQITAKTVPVQAMEHSYVNKLESSILRIRNFVVAHTDYMKGNEDEAVAALVRDVKDAMYHASDALSLFLLNIEEREQFTGCCTGFLNCWDIVLKREISVLGRQMDLLLRKHIILVELAELGLLRRRSRQDVDRIYHTHTASLSMALPNMVRDHQMEQDSEKIINHIVMNPAANDFTVLAIVGAAGIGKTVLANIIFNSEIVHHHFSASIWLNVTGNWSELDLLQSAISSFIGVNERSDKSRLASILHQHLQNRRLMLVMDDVWSAETWNDLLRYPLSSCAPGSCVIVTTRNENVAAMMQASHIHRVHKLKPDVSWSLLKKQVSLS